MLLSFSLIYFPQYFMIPLKLWGNCPSARSEIENYFERDRRGMNKTLLSLLILLILLPYLFLINTEPARGEDFSFVVISDSHTCIDRAGFSLYSPTKTVVDCIIKEIKPRLVLHSGDMISINSMTNNERDINEMWRIFNSGLRDRLLSSGISFFPSPGNHDVYGLGRACYIKEWMHFKNNGIKLLSGSYTDYYAFRYGTVLFISLDGSGLSLGSEQERWLDRTIDTYRDKDGPVVVYSHVGLTGRGRHPREVLQGNVMSILKKKKVQFYISGHQHFISQDYFGSLTHISAGSAGETPPFNYLVFRVSGKSIRWETRCGGEAAR